MTLCTKTGVQRIVTCCCESFAKLETSPAMFAANFPPCQYFSPGTQTRAVPTPLRPPSAAGPPQLLSHVLYTSSLYSNHTPAPSHARRLCLSPCTEFIISLHSTNAVICQCSSSDAPPSLHGQGRGGRDAGDSRAHSCPPEPRSNTGQFPFFFRRRVRRHVGSVVGGFLGAHWVAAD